MSERCEVCKDFLVDRKWRWYDANYVNKCCVDCARGSY